MVRLYLIEFISFVMQKVKEIISFIFVKTAGDYLGSVESVLMTEVNFDKTRSISSVT